jgi:hypothetical protein
MEFLPPKAQNAPKRSFLFYSGLFFTGVIAGALMEYAMIKTNYYRVLAEAESKNQAKNEYMNQ